LVAGRLTVCYTEETGVTDENNRESYRCLSQ